MTLDEIRADRMPFPTWVLDGAESVLLLYCAGRMGVNDGIHVLDAGVADVVGVDIQQEFLDRMSALYPSTWQFVRCDALGYLFKATRTFDVIVADSPWLEKARYMEQSLKRLADFKRVATKHVVLGIWTDLIPIAEELGAVEIINRASEGSWWAVW